MTDRTSNQRPFQGRVVDWMMETFSMEVCRNTTERNHRFLEEALELVQAMGCTAAEAHMLVDYTFGRPVGDPEQEVGGALVTLAALCSAADISMAELGERELARCWQNIDRIRFKQAGKPRSSPLPGPSPVETQPVASNPDHERWLAETWKMIETCATDIRSSNVTLSPEGCRALLGERNAHETSDHLSDDVACVLTDACMILDVVKGEWAEAWSEWDQGVRDRITRLLIANHEARPGSKETRRLGLAAQIDAAKKRIAAWPADVRAALGLPEEPAGALPPAALVISAADDPSHL